MNTFSRNLDLGNDLLLALMSFAKGRAKTLELNTSPVDALSDGGRRLVEQLASNMVSEDRVSEWPGTTLASGPKVLRTSYEVNEDTVEAICEAVSTPFELASPEYPEDLSLHRSDGSILFASTSHESDAWFELTPKEAFRIV